METESKGGQKVWAEEYAVGPMTTDTCLLLVSMADSSALLHG